MIEGFLKSPANANLQHDNIILDPLQILIRLYIQDDVGAVIPMFKRCRINPSHIKESA